MTEIQTNSEFKARNGAEALIDLIKWHGCLAIRKRRVPKSYRNPNLDQMLRSRRTKEESLILHAAKLFGVNCPKLIFADPESCEILMEYIQGVHIKDIQIGSFTRGGLKSIYLKLGETAARLHAGKIAHGDLTTKNLLVKEGEIFVIDFGLSFFSERLEDRADDMHLLKQALKSTSTTNSSALAYSYVMKGYEKVAGRRNAALLSRQVLEIEKRGRYARVD